MNPYIVQGSDIYDGTSFLLNFLDSGESDKYDSIIYENLEERDVLFSQINSFEDQLIELNDKLVSKNIFIHFLLSAVPHDYYKIYNKSNIKLYCNPFYFIHYLINNCNIQKWDFYNIKYKRLYQTNTFDSLLLTLNRRVSKHRCLVLDYLEKYEILDICSYTWANIESDTEYQFRWWNPITKTSIDISEKYNCKDVLKSNPAFQLVTESEHDKISFSEKVFKPILAGIPFIVAGGKNLHKKLQEYGFELYDEIFDYSFDSYDDVEYRVIGIIENFNKIKNKNYKDIVDLIYHKVEKNRNHAIEIFNNKKFIDADTYKLYDIIKNNTNTQFYTFDKLNKYLT